MTESLKPKRLSASTTDCAALEVMGAGLAPSFAQGRSEASREKTIGLLGVRDAAYNIELSCGSQLTVMPVFRIKPFFVYPAAIAVLAPLIVLSSVSAALAKACAPEHKEAVVDAINQFFEAATHDDENLFKEILAPGFYAFDNGKRFDGMQLPQVIKAAHAAGKTYAWSVNDPEVHITCDWAWVTYTNRGSVGDASATQPMSWLESAVLHYQGQRWHIQFLHSTRAAPPTSN